MGFIDVELEEIEGLKAGAKPHAPGQALLRIKGLEVKENNAKNGHYINFELSLQTVNGEKPEHDSPVWHTASLKKAALWNLNGLATACGVQTANEGNFLNRLRENGTTLETTEEFLKEVFTGTEFKDAMKLSVYDKDENQEIKLDDLASLNHYQDTDRYKPSNKLAGKYKRA